MACAAAIEAALPEEEEGEEDDDGDEEEEGEEEDEEEEAAAAAAASFAAASAVAAAALALSIASRARAVQEATSSSCWEVREEDIVGLGPSSRRRRGRGGVGKRVEREARPFFFLVNGGGE